MSVEDFTDRICREIAGLACGDLLGTGRDRDVFVTKTDPERVIKIERTARSFQNASEWMVWTALREYNARLWLAPCYDISVYGSALVQARTVPLTEDRLKRTMVPNWMCDLKPENFGILNDRVVAHDYGTLHVAGVLEQIRTNTKIVKPEWRRSQQ